MHEAAKCRNCPRLVVRVSEKYLRMSLCSRKCLDAMLAAARAGAPARVQAWLAKQQGVSK